MSTNDTMWVRHCPSCGWLDYTEDQTALPDGTFRCPQCGMFHRELAEISEADLQ